MLIGKIDSGSFIKVIAEIPPKFTVTFKDGDTVLQQVQVKKGKTAVYNGTVQAKDGNAFLGWVLSEPSNQIVDTDIFSETIYQQITNVQSNVTCWAVYDNHAIIRDSWDVISQRSLAGTASDYYNVGDMKRIHIQGTVGTLTVNQDVYVYILGFDHNATLEGNGIAFGCFKDVTDLTDIALVDHKYYDSTGYFNQNDFIIAKYGNICWKTSSMRYNILGSTDVSGDDATQNCAITPVSNSLMSCLPLNLRTVMKPMTKYTFNGGTYDFDNDSSFITSTIEYLPLLAEYEITGKRQKASVYEQAKQEQYSYFNNGGSKIKYPHSNISATYPVIWWTRSASHLREYRCICYPNNWDSYNVGTYSLGIAPIFLV